MASAPAAFSSSLKAANQVFFAGHACGLRQSQQQGRRVNLISESTTLKVGYTNLHVGVKAPGTAKMTLRFPRRHLAARRVRVLLRT